MVSFFMKLLFYFFIFFKSSFLVFIIPVANFQIFCNKILFCFSFKSKKRTYGIFVFCCLKWINLNLFKKKNLYKNTHMQSICRKNTRYRRRKKNNNKKHTMLLLASCSKQLEEEEFQNTQRVFLFTHNTLKYTLH